LAPISFFTSFFFGVVKTLSADPCMDQLGEVEAVALAG
jgi:hypothetical protein